MAFDFPDAPAVGDEYSSGGATYTYTADGVWDLGSAAVSTDYVLKAGDVMTGNLQAHGGHIAIGPASGLETLRLGSGGGADHAGIIEFYAPDGTTRRGFFGYGTANQLNLNFENGVLGLKLNAGISFGSVAVSDPNDCRKHLKLWENTADAAKGFGINITSGRQNYTVDSTSNSHCFMCGDTQAYTIDNVGSVGNLMSGTAFLDRTLVDEPQMANFAEGEGARRGVNVGQLLRWALLEILELKAEVAQLKGRK